MIVAGAMIGLGATILMDLWAWLLSRLPGQPPVNWAPVGRWFWHLREGRIFHDDIAASAPFAAERAFGWFCHYAVGILYGVIFVMLAGRGWLDHPRFIPAWIFGIVTVGAGWFLLQPGLGLGWAASRLPHPNRVRALNLAAHSVFAIGLYLTAWLIVKPA